HEPDVEIPISITGLREGEKLHEVLHGEQERLEPSSDGKIFEAVQSGGVSGDFEADVSSLIEAARNGSAGEVLRMLAGIVPGFDPGDSPSS
ncbi:MAG TPA: polysaccharide biosynthesis protein, partial [Candidatus Krumholzibacterium sp.]|nr:polysaccharide biosynthesis protein [Candidatus Krumholzibacterium sp.]